MISLFFGISTLLFIGKGDFLIAGLNAMSKEEKEKIDTFKLNRFMGKMMYVISVGMLLLFLYRFYNYSLLLALALLLLVVPTIFIAIFTFNFDRFRK
jgi:polyferredoxin